MSSRLINIRRDDSAFVLRFDERFLELFSLLVP